MTDGQWDVREGCRKLDAILNAPFEREAREKAEAQAKVEADWQASLKAYRENQSVAGAVAITIMALIGTIGIAAFWVLVIAALLTIVF